MQTQITDNWQRVKLGDVLNIRRGASPRPIHEYITTSGMPWLKIADVSSSGSRYVESTKEYIRDEGISKSVIVKPGDLILSNSATPGIPRFMNITACVHDGWLILEPKNGFINKDYLFYRLLIDRKKLVSNVTGAVFDNLKTDVLRGHEVLLPPIHLQENIGSILSAFDDKIEVNNKIAKTLEEMAQAVFKELFVNFRFPGHEKPEFVNNELRKIPKGWKLKNLFDIAEITYGYPFKSSLFNEDGKGTPVIRIRNIPDNRTNTYTVEKVDEKYKVKNGDILVGMDGEFYIRKWSGGDAYLNQRVVRLRPKEGLSWYLLFLSIKSPIKIFQDTIGGTTVAHLSDRNLRSINMLIPDRNTLTTVLRILDVYYWKEVNLLMENAKLSAIRDFLLPKLMKGEISV